MPPPNQIPVKGTLQISATLVMYPVPSHRHRRSLRVCFPYDSSYDKLCAHAQDDTIIRSYEHSEHCLRLTMLGRRGQSEAEDCTPRRVVGRPQAAPMRFDNGTADPKSHAEAVRFGGKESIEYLVRRLRGQPHTGIAD